MILGILNQLATTRSKLEKEAILKANQDNEVLKKVFLATYDPMISYYMIKIPDYTPNDLFIAEWEDVFGALDKLSSREVTGGAAKAMISTILSNLDPDDAEVVERILKRDLRVGCSSSTANKVWKDLIKKYPCMLCESYSEKNLARITYPALVQEKCDGMRVNFVVDGNAVQVFGRSGKPINLLGALDESILGLMANMNQEAGMIDGELLVLTEEGDTCDRATGNGILNRAIKGTITLDEAKQVFTKVWDFIPKDEFSSVKNAKGTTPLTERWDMVKNGASLTGCPKVLTPETEVVTSLEQARDFYAAQLKKGNEGAVLKNLSDPWENRRSRGQVKLKVENCVELVVVDKYEGTGRNAGTLGGLTCQSLDGGLVVNLGGGYSDVQRAEYWKSETIVGSIITAKANDYQTSEGRDTYALFLPVFIEERLEKDTANTTEEILQMFNAIYGRN